MISQSTIHYDMNYSVLTPYEVKTCKQSSEDVIEAALTLSIEVFS